MIHAHVAFALAHPPVVPMIARRHNIQCEQHQIDQTNRMTRFNSTRMIMGHFNDGSECACFGCPLLVSLSQVQCP
eukprot:2830808-Amphidinium_carterae.1